MIDFDYVEKEVSRITYFGNFYLIIATLMLHLPYVFNWGIVDNVDGLISLNTLSFIYVGFMFSLVSSLIIKRKLTKDEEKILNQIYLLKINNTAGKAFDYLLSKYSKKYLNNDYRNIKYYISKLYYRTTAKYKNDLMNTKGLIEMYRWVLIGIVLQSVFVVFLQELYLQFELGWYETLVFFLTMLLGGIYGYKAGINISLNHDVHPLKIIDLTFEQFFKENGISKRQVSVEERLKVEFYDLRNDNCIKI